MIELGKEKGGVVLIFMLMNDLDDKEFLR